MMNDFGVSIDAESSSVFNEIQSQASDRQLLNKALEFQQAERDSI